MSSAAITSRLVHLDALRGIAALVVVIGHVRGFVLVDFSDSDSRSLLNMGIYFAAGLGHSAVLAFFALSGFLVGGSALRSMIEGTWSGPHYIVARLSRLWTVAGPALALTWLVDRLGNWIMDGAGYDGRYWTLLSSGPTPDVAVALGLETFLGNVLFLQTIAVPVLGTNGPLWSLANEFWYYVLYPLVAWAFIGRGLPWIRAGVGGLALALALVLPLTMMVLGFIWFIGALANTALRCEQLARVVAHPAYCGTSLLLVGCALVLGCSGVRGGIGWDLLQGVAWVVALPALATLPALSGLIGAWYRYLAIGLSDISYTLYAIHFPILAVIYFTLLAPMQWQPSAAALGIGSALLAVVLASASAVWWLFERNTPQVRKAALRLLALDQRNASR